VEDGVEREEEGLGAVVRGEDQRVALGQQRHGRPPEPPQPLLHAHLRGDRERPEKPEELVVGVPVERQVPAHVDPGQHLRPGTRAETARDGLLEQVEDDPRHAE
jgi:hypothetical protein